LSCAGGLVGLGAGAGAVEVLRRSVGWQMSIDLGAAAISLSLAVALGWLFGVVPALTAARVTPVEALRDA
jgi:putative ABC transport system permease protein